MSQDPNTYTNRETASTPLLRDALKHSKRKRMKCATTDIEQTSEGKRQYDENYEAIFGKRELKHGID